MNRRFRRPPADVETRVGRQQEPTVTIYLCWSSSTAPPDEHANHNLRKRPTLETTRFRVETPRARDKSRSRRLGFETPRARDAAPSKRLIDGAVGGWIWLGGFANLFGNSYTLQTELLIGLSILALLLNTLRQEKLVEISLLKKDKQLQLLGKPFKCLSFWN